MVDVFDFSIDYMNRLFCTFSPKDALDATLQRIRGHYTVLYDKVFVLESQSSEEYLCTYNIDTHNSTSNVLENTILFHRKKESNTLYTINALNLLIKQLNSGVLDTNYRIPWNEYRNTVMLTQENELRLLPTRIYRITTS